MTPINLVYETVMIDKGDRLNLSKQMPIFMEISQKINDLAFSSVFLFLKKKIKVHDPEIIQMKHFRCHRFRCSNKSQVEGNSRRWDCFIKENNISVKSYFDEIDNACLKQTNKKIKPNMLLSVAYCQAPPESDPISKLDYSVNTQLLFLCKCDLRCPLN